MSDDDRPECTCQLVDVTTYADLARGEVKLIRGEAYGCVIHETEADRERQRRLEAVLAETPVERERRLQQEADRAEYARRYAEAEKAARSA